MHDVLKDTRPLPNNAIVVGSVLHNDLHYAFVSIDGCDVSTISAHQSAHAAEDSADMFAAAFQRRQLETEEAVVALAEELAKSGVYPFAPLPATVVQQIVERIATAVADRN